MLTLFKSMLFYILLLQSTYSILRQTTQQQIRQQTITSQIVLNISNQLTYIMYNGTYSTNFLEVAAENNFYSCAQKDLYTIFQTQTQLSQNSSYYIIFTSTNPINRTYSVVAINGIVPTSGQILPESSSTQLILQIYSDCSNINYIEYFDRIRITVEGFTTIQFDFVCFTHYFNQTFSAGSVIQVAICTILVSIFAFFGRAWSIKGAGIKLKWWYVVILNTVIIILYVLIYFFLNVMVIVYDIFGWLMSIVSVWLCSNEIFFFLRIKGFNAGFKIWKTKFRIMDFMSALLAIIITSTWYFGNKNWIANDVIFICATATVVKLLKFTSLKIVLITFAINTIFLVIYVIGAVLLIVFSPVSYETIFNFILTINYPLFLQLPTITKVYSFKCSYISLITTGLQGMLLNYLRRFDKSWSTSIYLVIGIIIFLFGSIVWIALSFVTSYILQFRMANIGIIMTPITIIVVLIFAYRRGQTLVIWNGKFYDEEFNNRGDLDTINEYLDDRRSTVLRRDSNFNGLRLRQISFMTNITVTSRRQTTGNQMFDLVNSKNSSQDNKNL